MGQKKKTIVIATGNPGKVREFSKILGEEGFEFKTLKDIGFHQEIVEDGDSFAANAEIKARAVFSFCKCAVLADDSGLETEALDGAPGIYSARFAGENASDQDNNDKLLEQLQGKDNRKARFTCALCYMDDSTLPVLFDGHCPGTIISSPRGENGFGYDPLFVPEGHQSTFAEMSQDEKKSLSHRGQAIKRFQKWFMNQ